MKRMFMGGALIAIGAGILTLSSGVAGGSPPVALVFNDAAQQVTLTIPTPPCAPDQQGCKWVLFVNEPDVAGKPVVGSVTGTSGVLTVKYPADFCGVLQADARTGPPFVQVYGLLHHVGGDCPPPPASTTTTSTTSAQPTGTTEPPPTPPNVSATASSPPAPGAAAPTNDLPATEAPAVAGTSSPAASDSPAASGTSQLPFTGVDVKPLLVVGSASVVTGLALLIRRRRPTP